MTKIYDAGNHLLIHAAYANPAEHSHMAAHIIISPKRKMHVTSDGAEYACQGIMIPSGVPHTVDTHGEAVLVFLYDCTTGAARQIRKTQCISEACCKHVAMLYAALDQERSKPSYCRFEMQLLSQLGIAGSSSPISDDRIASAMAYIRAAAGERLSLQTVADAVHLSAGRLSHLFKEQAGMTFAAYLIYQRIVAVYTEILRGKSITQAAIDAGFSSSAHFADVNRRIFGISASSITRNLEFYKIQ